MINALKKCSGKATIIILLAILTVSLVFTFGEDIGIPTWNELRGGYGTGSDELLKVTYLSVGDGDCAYVEGNNFNMVIDTGYPTYESKLADILRLKNVKRIDVLIISHGDEDHIGNTLEVMKSFDVGVIIAPKSDKVDFTKNYTYNEIIDFAKQKNIEVKYAECGDEFLFNDNNIILRVIAPMEQFSDINNNSLVIKLLYRDSSYLFTGDIEIKAQKSLLENGAELAADVVKVPHHGRASSFCEEFMQSVNADIAVISCGSTEKFYVSHKLLKFLENNNVCVYRTDTDGSVAVSTTGDGKYTVSIND